MKRILALLFALVLLTQAFAPAESDSCTFTLAFSFDEVGSDMTGIINRALSGMELTDVEIVDKQGYMIRTTLQENGNTTVELGYGFESITFKCVKSNEDGGVWQMGAEAFDKEVYRSGDEFKAAWDAVHPEYVIRMLSIYDYGTAYAFIYLYHLKPN